MKAVRYHSFGGPEVLTLEEVPLLPPGDDEVQVRCRVSGVNFGDTMKRRNVYPQVAAMPAVPGVEAAGIVESVGRNVQGLAPGDRVLVIAQGGCYAQFVIASQRQVYRIPDEITFEQAVCLPGQGLTSYFMLEEALMDRTLPSVLVHAAAGGVGMFLVQLARLMGAGNIVGTVGSDAKARLLEEEGFADAVNYSDHDWVEQALAANGNAPYDLIFDSVGGSILSRSFSILAEGGQITVFGRASGESVLIDPVDLVMKNQSLRGFSLIPYVAKQANHDLVVEALAQLFEYIVEDRLKPKITGRFALSQAGFAHRLMEERKTTGKIVLSADLDKVV